MTDPTEAFSSHKPRHCPRCTYPLTAVMHEGTEVDHCHRCGGTLVEPGEAAARLGPYADPSYWLAHLAQQTTGTRLVCPVDTGPMTGYQVPWRARSVVVDHCADCGSLWLDHGEGEKLADIVRQAEADGAFRGDKQRHEPLNHFTSDDVAAQQDQAEKPGVGTYVFQLFTGMPVEVWNPTKSKAFTVEMLTWSLVAIFVIHQLFILSWTEAIEAAVLRTFGLVPSLVVQGENLWGLVTHGFLHLGLLHILGNAYFLWTFGDNVEDRVGRRYFLLLYGTAMIGAAALQIVFQTDSSIPMVGASGAIAGLMGAYLMLFPRVKLWMVFFFIQWRVPVVLYLGGSILLQFVMGYFDVPGVGWWAHIGGFMVGLLFGFLMRDLPHPRTPQETRASRHHAAP